MVAKPETVLTSETDSRRSVSMKHSASRALALLKALNLRAVSSVKELAQDTGISKPSVVRLLGILMEDGFVKRSSLAGSYALTRNVLQLSAGFRDDSIIVSCATPVMGRLTDAIEWPTALGIFERGDMVVRHSTIPTSPLAWYRTTLHMRLGLLNSAMGQIYLAHCDETTRKSLLRSCNDSNFTQAEQSEAFFARVKTRGYGLRTANTDHPTFSISVPVVVDDTIAAALSVTIYAQALTVKEAIERYLSPLRASAAEIVANIETSKRDPKSLDNIRGAP